jgi:hypothetical protein
MAVVASISSGSIIHMRAARRFAEMAAGLDIPGGLNGLDTTAQDVAIGELMSVSLAAVLAANSAVESVVNELFAERTLLGQQHWFPGLRDDIGLALASTWRGVERYEVITKCQIAAAIAGKPRLDFGAGSAQQLVALIELRNALIHHKPISIEHDREALDSTDPIQRKLHGMFELSRLCDRSYTFRWVRCLCSGCASWAYDTAANFQKDFFSLLRTDYPRS